ncbi:hypothetical protein PVAP13_9KG097320 [Panicum virgatum]|uniref:Uncharacterized protein n=1 Tax=Panicum virgatum TaxID=38727 RepID=A0A8T0NF35_PANVG|nr:hypothetical protein PVAP13_9KG097320 [Panicum virgatum]
MTAARPSPSRTRRRRASPRLEAEFRPRLHGATQLTSSPSSTSASTPWLLSFSLVTQVEIDLSYLFCSCFFACFLSAQCMEEFCTSWASRGRMKEMVAPCGEQPATSPAAGIVAVSPPRLDVIQLAIVQFAVGACP